MEDSVADEIAKLAALREQGLLTEAEFLQRKELILGTNSVRQTRSASPGSSGRWPLWSGWLIALGVILAVTGGVLLHVHGDQASTNSNPDNIDYAAAADCAANSLGLSVPNEQYPGQSGCNTRAPHPNKFLVPLGVGGLALGLVMIAVFTIVPFQLRSRHRTKPI